ncbi:4-hydroxy-tetrahydrodipicolinate synthase [Sediminibacillus massiliensis]|uniref:4-hydroxy-tetrahydrodipicolinate synthase n=1 Tax=Sediminibacillus massiliensis TaxID=1926277 RepID=UPI0009885B1E|nr:4-hydroxy-tetrahydrodipicolinate synthase [Sediminibacillus massiliensis]
MDFGRVLTAMVTPFDQNGEIDLEKTTELVDYLIENGSDGLVVAGTTGESPTLSTEEKLLLFNHVVKVVNKRVPVIAGTGSNNTLASAEFTKKAEKTGIDAVLLVTPYYNKPDQAGLVEHFKSIASCTDLPVMLYNIPGRSVINMEPETIIELSKLPNIVSVKESSGNLENISRILENTNSFSVYSGDDSLTLPIKAIGGTGVVSVASHIIGNDIQKMLAAYEKGDVRSSAAMHRKLLPVMEALFMAPSPVPVKTALRHIGLEVGSVRLPLVELTENQKEKLIERLQIG